MSLVCLWTLAMMWCHKGHYWPLTDTSTQVSDVNGTMPEQRCYFFLLTGSCKLRFFFSSSIKIPEWFPTWSGSTAVWDEKNKDQQNHFSLTIVAPPQVCLMHPRAELYTCHLPPASSHSRAWTRDSANWRRSTWDDGLVEEITAWKK